LGHFGSQDALCLLDQPAGIAGCDQLRPLLLELFYLQSPQYLLLETSDLLLLHFCLEAALLMLPLDCSTQIVQFISE
jgi:hypothetical protein